MQGYVDVLLSILNIPFVLFGITLTLGQFILYFILAGIVCFLLGGLLR